jgi:hypothetical protein
MVASAGFVACLCARALAFLDFPFKRGVAAVKKPL